MTQSGPAKAGAKLSDLPRCPALVAQVLAANWSSLLTVFMGNCCTFPNAEGDYRACMLGRVSQQKSYDVASKLYERSFRSVRCRICQDHSIYSFYIT